MNVSILDQHVFLAFWIGFSRWIAVLFQLPLFDNVSVPMIIKVLTSFLLAFAFFPGTQGTLIAEVKLVGPDNIWLLMMFHTTTGLINSPL
jgi:flagellar biosynthetic protein FliR